jgi:hypothetical protein
VGSVAGLWNRFHFASRCRPSSTGRVAVTLHVAGSVRSLPWLTRVSSPPAGTSSGDPEEAVEEGGELVQNCLLLERVCVACGEP